jgi:hypothetical protein
MKQRSALPALTAVVFTTLTAGCHKSPPVGAPPPGAGGFVSSPIAFVQSGASCVSLKEDPVRARSYDDVVWGVIAQPTCGFEGQTVEIVFTSGGDPGRCQCTDPIRNGNAKLKLKIKNHQEHRSYTYEIRVNGKPVTDPRLEVDPGS